jgi:hypothetical protein
LLLLLVLATLLCGCSPGIALNLYNATGETLTITNPPLRLVTTIPPNTAADISIADSVLVRSPHHTWTYSVAVLRPPVSLFEKHTMLWRAFGKIDARGHISLFAPPPDHGIPQSIPQPPGFPVKPQKT